jgi:hypothetical protein
VEALFSRRINNAAETLFSRRINNAAEYCRLTREHKLAVQVPFIAFLQAHVATEEYSASVSNAVEA